jgi:hypothetical protein
MQSWIRWLQRNHGALLGGGADLRVGACWNAGDMGPKPQAIGLKDELQTIPRRKPHQLAQPGPNPRQPLEESVQALLPARV